MCVEHISVLFRRYLRASVTLGALAKINFADINVTTAVTKAVYLQDTRTKVYLFIRANIFLSFSKEKEKKIKA